MEMVVVVVILMERGQISNQWVEFVYVKWNIGQLVIYAPTNKSRRKRLSLE